MNLDLSLVIKMIVGWFVLCLTITLAWARWFKYQKDQDIIDAHYRENKL